MTTGSSVYTVLAVVLVWLCPCVSDAAAVHAEPHVRSLVFGGPDSVSRYYRIPALAVAGDNSIVAVADRRFDSESDLPGKIDVVSRRSTDGGRTWQPAVTVAVHDSGGGYGDPAIGVDSVSGDLVCVFTHGNGLWQSTPDNHASICVSRSSDGGCSWSEPVDITAGLFGTTGNEPVRAITAFASSGHMLTCANGDMWFCLVARADGRSDAPLHVYPVRSVDGGRNWEVITPAVDNDGDESKMAELADGSLLMSIRNRWKGYRKFARSFDGGKSWSAVAHSSSLPDPACNGDMLVLPDGRIVHSINDSHTDRCCVSLFVYDPVETVWRKTVEICPGPSSYSALCRLADGRVGVLSEELSPGHGLHIWFTSVDTGMFDL